MWVIICKNNPIHTHTWRAAQSPLPPSYPTHGDEFLGPIGLGNGPYVLGNGPPLLGIMSHSGLCRLALCRSALFRIRGYVVRHNVAFGICRILPYVVRLCVVRRIVARPNVVRRNVVRPTVGVSNTFRHGSANQPKNVRYLIKNYLVKPV